MYIYKDFFFSDFTKYACFGIKTKYLYYMVCVVCVCMYEKDNT